MSPELFLAGYPPEDLVLKPAFQEACRSACEDLARDTADGGPAALVGLPWVEEGKLYNAMALLDGGRIEAVRFKVDLPNYGVFDEKRVFAPGPSPGPIVFRGVRIGVPICEDIWGPDPVECIARDGRRDPAGRQRLALRARQSRRPPEHRGGPSRRKRPAADLPQPGRRPGRTRLRGRLVRAQRRPQPRRAIAGLPAHGRAHGLGARRRRLALRRGRGRTRRGRRRSRLYGLRPGLARLCRE